MPLVASHTATLSCSQGSWAGDLLESFLYRAPQRISFQWLRNERPIPGATTSSLVATEVGDYTCRATASNAAGSTAQDSASVNISASLKLGKAVLNAEKGIAKIPVATSGTGVVALSGKGVKPTQAEVEAGQHRAAAGDPRPQAAGQGQEEARIRRRGKGEGEDLLHADQRVAADQDEVVQPAAGGGLTRNRAWST